MRKKNKHYWIPFSFFNTKNKEIEVKFNTELSDLVKDSYNLEERLKIYDQLVISEEMPNFDYEIIPDFYPSVENKFPYSRNDIFTYLMNFKAFMEDSEFGLLTDNRPSVDY